MKGEKDPQLNTASIKLRFWLVCVYKAWARWMWAVLSEWDGINTEIEAFVSNGLFVSSWRTFLSYGCVEGWEEYLGLDEYRLKMMSDELKES